MCIRDSLDARCKGGARPADVKTLALHQIGVIHAAGFDLNDQLVRGRDWLGRVDDMQVRDVAEAIDSHLPHRAVLAIRAATCLASRAMPRRYGDAIDRPKRTPSR